MKRLVFNNRDYEVTENEDEVLLTDISNNTIKFDISFSKDPKENAVAREGLKIFFSEVFS